MSVPADTVAALAALAREPLTVVDAGCRWGAQDQWLALGDAVHLYGFDADAQECRRLQEAAGPDAAVTYVPVGLGRVDGTQPLHVTREPGCSSLYPPNPDVLRDVPELALMTPERMIDVDLRSLASWAMETGVPRVDAMKLDVQGAELDVLQGAGDLLDGVRLLEAEVCLNPLYTGQPLFGDIDAFLRSRGFVLWRLEHLVFYGHRGGSKRPGVDRQFFDSELVEFASRPGQVFWGHAYFCAQDLPGGRAGATFDDELRDAMLAAAFGFDDLLHLTGRRALELAGDERRAALQAALDIGV